MLKQNKAVGRWLHLLILMLAGRVMAGDSSSGDAVQYNRDVRPILAENCFSCHGTDSAARKAGLRLDRFDGATNKLDDGAVAIVPGKPEASELVRRIFADDDDHMPPAKIGKTLTPKQKSILTNWISAGAVYQPHWSFLPPVKAPLPVVQNQAWVRNPIDDFILARLEQTGLEPNGEADKRTLIRRVTLDLTGLPPKPEEVEKFVRDLSPKAYEKLVDRLLASPAWGEHRARYWLDTARYGDTHGIHFDDYREMWSYRDWVIKAFNQNMPFDEFTVENLAGDLLPNATQEQKIGSGFNRCNTTSNEGGAIDAEYYVLYARDRTETTSQTWLGLTAGCAVCHDHKYDPFSQKDFYSLSAFFNNITMKAMDGNVKDTPPVIVVPLPADRQRWEQVPGDIKLADQKLEQRAAADRGEFTNWLNHPVVTGLSRHLPTGKPVFQAELKEGTGDQIQVSLSGTNRILKVGANTNWQDGAIAAKAYTISGKEAPVLAGTGDFERTNAFSYSVWVRLKDMKSGALFSRMEDKDGHFRGWDLFLDNGRPIFHLLHDWPDNALKVTGRNELPANRWNHVCITYDGSSKAQGVKLYINGKLQETDKSNDSLTGTTRTSASFKLGQRDTTSPVTQAGLQDLNIFARVLTPEEVLELMQVPRLQWLAAKSPARLAPEETNELFGLWLGELDAPYQKLAKQDAALKKEKVDIRARSTVAYVMDERTNAAEAHVLFRGEYDQPRERVTPNTPSALPPMPADAPHNRLGFAQWLLLPQNPLPARVTVNRFWQELFGTGLVKTAGDFGVAGEQPSHPELLDWLAVDFREHGWDVKRLFKLMVMSQTYRQSSAMTPEKWEKDPENRLLARGPRFRMDAEMVRDYALAASGLLVEKIGGPSVRPYQPPGIWEVVGMPDGDTRHYMQDHGTNLYRRSVYTFWKRQAPPASMEIFNAPSREFCTARRERTDTPLQALVTLNDPQFVEAARHLAQVSLEQKHNAANFMAERLLARPLTPAELQIVAQDAADLLAHYKAEPKEAEQLLAVGESKPDPRLDAPTLAAYTMLANELMNLDEVLNK